MDPLSDEAPAALITLLEAQRAVAAAPLSIYRIAAVILCPADGYGVSATFYGAQIPASEWPEAAPEDEEDDDDAPPLVSGGRYGRAYNDVDVPRPEIDVAGSGHALHETRTDIATRGLIRGLADDPGAALTVLLAQLFKSLALHSSSSLDESAAQISATAYRRGAMAPIATLDGEVYARLEARRDAYRASGLRPILWVETLPRDEKMALLAELTAHFPQRSGGPQRASIRAAARARGGRDRRALRGGISRPTGRRTEPYLAVHSKTQLLRPARRYGRRGRPDPGDEKARPGQLRGRGGGRTAVGAGGAELGSHGVG